MNGILPSPLRRNRVGAAVQTLGRLDIEVEQPAERQIDVDHLVGRDPLGEARQIVELCLGERHGRVGPEPRPLFARIGRHRGRTRR